MSMLTKLFFEALPKLLGEAENGAVAYIRCLPRAFIEKLYVSRDLSDEWVIYLVGNPSAHDNGCITADHAVELREAKGTPVLFLVDTNEAGAGMDGIYSAAKEINEVDLFSVLNVLALKQIKHLELRSLSDKAIKRSQRLAHHRILSPWRKYEFLCSMAETDPQLAGGLLTMLGLWPVDLSLSINYDNDLDVSARIVERLFPPLVADKLPSIRVESLLLPCDEHDCGIKIEQMLSTLGVRGLDFFDKLWQNNELWLNRIHPGFAIAKVSNIKIVSWFTPRGTLNKWSGLKNDDDGLLVFVLSRLDENGNPAEGGKTPKLEIRWKTEPEELRKGTASYEVEIRSCDDILAVSTVEHMGKEFEKALFYNEDFDIDIVGNDSRFEAKAIIRIIGTGIEVETPEFTIFRGEMPESSTTTNARVVRCLIDGAIELTKDKFEELVSLPRNDTKRFCTDKRGRVVVRHANKSFCIVRPFALKSIELDWMKNPAIIARWRIRIREDGTMAGPPEQIEICKGTASDKAWNRVVEASKSFVNGLSLECGMLARLYKTEDYAADEYIAAWSELLSDESLCEPLHSLAHTAEILNLSGQPIGLLVLPSHPLRTAWQMGYDALAYHLAYEMKLKPKELKGVLDGLVPSQVPFILPGLIPNRSFLFGDTLGMAFAAMVVDNDPEPKNSISLMAACLEIDENDSPSIGGSTSNVIAKELCSYIDLHQNVFGGLLRVHAWRAGDAMTIARAMGNAKREFDKVNNNPEYEDGFIFNGQKREIAYDLTMISHHEALSSGRFLAEISQNRRSGVKAISERDAWMLSVVGFGGNRNRPQLRWRRHILEHENEHKDAHIAVVFDSFKTDMVFTKEVSENIAPSSLWGLIPLLDRVFSINNGVPEWQLSFPYRNESKPYPVETHPAARKYGIRIHRLHNAVIMATAAQRGHFGEWPCIITRLESNNREHFRALHENCDWVVSIDRNVGIEYFDSPKDVKDTYETYIIDAVPERDDLGCLQVITSTSNADEVRILLDMATDYMGLSNSKRNSEFLFNHLKALSGRLAIQLAAPAAAERARNSGELLALAMSRANCLEAKLNDGTWLSLQNGFFIPIDDIRDILPFYNNPEFVEETNDKGESFPQSRRADLIYVQLHDKRLSFRIVEVKYRRHMQHARNPSLHDEIIEQIESSFSGLSNWFFINNHSANSIVSAIRRVKLARVLRYYVEKAYRHHLPQEKYDIFKSEISRLISNPNDYEFSIPFENLHRGYVFCPEFAGNAEIMRRDEISSVSVHIFGTETLPDPVFPNNQEQQPFELETKSESTQHATVPSPTVFIDAIPTTNSKVISHEIKSKSDTKQSQNINIPQKTQESDGQAIIDLGRPLSGNPERLKFTISVKGNPHLLIVGQSGMGKTTCLGGICRQLALQGVTPIVFSFHQDIDNQIETCVGKTTNFPCPDIGFNPMTIDSSKPFAHVENSGMLRDIFSAIYPDLGDIQLEELRKAIKDAYESEGWGKEGITNAQVPKFVNFHRILKERNANKGLLARLEELENYNFFADSVNNGSLLDLRTPMVFQAHVQQNEVLQNAYAIFILYRLYKDLFRRGPQPGITHAVILDEAHRASHLKLLSTMAKECRKYGVAMILASQEVKDFDSSLFSAVANFLVLRIVDQDARVIARNLMPSDKERAVRDKLVQMKKYHAMFFSEAYRQPCTIELDPP